MWKAVCFHMSQVVDKQFEKSAHAAIKSLHLSAWIHFSLVSLYSPRCDPARLPVLGFSSVEPAALCAAMTSFISFFVGVVPGSMFDCLRGNAAPAGCHTPTTPQRGENKNNASQQSRGTRTSGSRSGRSAHGDRNLALNERIDFGRQRVVAIHHLLVE